MNKFIYFSKYFKNKYIILKKINKNIYRYIFMYL